MERLESVGFINPSGNTKSVGAKKQEFYNKEKETIKKSFAELGDNIDWMEGAAKKKLETFARKIITTTIDTVNQDDLISSLLPVENIAPGDTAVWHEISGVNVWEGTYGAAVRMTEPQFTAYTAKTNLKEVGIKMKLVEIQTGKYSPSEMGEYTSNLITAWRNRLLFTTTLAGMTAYQSGGAQYTTGVGLTLATLLVAFETITDEGEYDRIVLRRYALHKLASQTGWSNETKREFETSGAVGQWMGSVVQKVNSFTDNDYGQVYPFPKTDVWIFSDLPAGKAVLAGAIRTSQETVLRNETLNLYVRWDDGFGIWKTNRIGRIVAS